MVEQERTCKLYSSEALPIAAAAIGNNWCEQGRARTEQIAAIRILIALVAALEPVGWCNYSTRSHLKFS
ncbi:hypothetical protein Mp_4g00470 [Marchantia polymorpha subsp. ruderalis]|uniref:Uncharacterized protein n=2 Tax=Marchantia polymorpha TaxID=3197 RepID=A0AAF6B4V9_MARPO|nr:hypothetical protein MARPO_0066s0094 [Marchantia polymorpha]BBN07043.1 hypothetical protein Mp_4g00470 [Marchantia polymorpha subsp. ruderalis]|eukprot:PTQ36141.1 hypothetical protein MARPO_0066s0094 [Marchantia polymorpha]